MDGKGNAYNMKSDNIFSLPGGGLKFINLVVFETGHCCQKMKIMKRNILVFAHSLENLHTQKGRDQAWTERKQVRIRKDMYAHMNASSMENDATSMSRAMTRSHSIVHTVICSYSDTFLTGLNC